MCENPTESTETGRECRDGVQTMSPALKDDFIILFYASVFIFFSVLLFCFSKFSFYLLKWYALCAHMCGIITISLLSPSARVCESVVIITCVVALGQWSAWKIITFAVTQFYKYRRCTKAATPMKRQSPIRVCARPFLIVSAGGALRKTAGIMYLTNIDAGIGLVALNLVAFDRQPAAISACDCGE